jgi:uncharacterized Zn finger protein (UPF0148 family)
MAMSLDSIPLGVVCPNCRNGIPSTYGLLRIAGRVSCDVCGTIVLIKVSEHELCERIRRYRNRRPPPPSPGGEPGPAPSPTV